MKKVLRPAEKRTRVDYLRQTYEVSISRACKVVNLSRSTYSYRSHRNDKALIEKLQGLSEKDQPIAFGKCISGFAGKDWLGIINGFTECISF